LWRIAAKGLNISGTFTQHLTSIPLERHDKWISCSHNLKEKPAIGDWGRCPLCHGTGYASIRVDQHQVNRDADHSEKRGCFLVYPYQYEVDKFNETMDKEKEAPIAREKTVKCPRCNGLGWIKSRDLDRYIDEAKMPWNR